MTTLHDNVYFQLLVYMTVTYMKSQPSDESKLIFMLHKDKSIEIMISLPPK
jgi:hypothetical protein